ncbi:MAG TPA: SMP-30/gluconolactonase/LRE family protein [Oligoflexus sp.]|uniref:SMP-30/gluconolactonase/LRE family protein n=1 Tax=Oligoflexus sp. TaxID=1971216 RepID=UPI002D6A128E|nr:SMP-30/gluconolactonase/LRE family protein [Oligoflexus sp.]HYX36685.1 SMP-30/gluconolactonase/LRE family protein [Oligoflexus sp.]
MTGFRSYLMPLFWILTGCRPEGFDAKAWNPPHNPGLLTTLPPNQDLVKADVVGRGTWDAPEDIALDGSGLIYAGSASGRIQRFQEGNPAELFVTLPGQVLGLDFDAVGNLYACVDRSGLWRVNPEGRAELVVESHAGRKLGLVDDVKVGADGLVYFSEATSKYFMDTHVRDVLEGFENGTLFRFDPARKSTEVLVDQLGFANGVAVAPDASYVLVSETSRYRIRKVWLTGPEAGKNIIFMDNLPGFPDGLSRMTNGKYWVAFISPRNTLLDTLHSRPFFKNFIAGLPDSLLPKDKPYGLIAAFNDQGHWLQSLHDPNGQVVPGITSVEEKDGKLWLGSLYGKALYSITPRAVLK